MATGVAIVLPFRNAAATLNECVESILCQGHEGFELIAVDDHSNDVGVTILSQFNDPRITLTQNPGKGLVDALNHGVAQTDNEWIFRMDADDRMHPDRLKIQLEYISRYKHVDCLAGRVRLFPESEVTDGMQRYVNWQNQLLTHRQMRDGLFQESPIAHPSVAFRKSLFTLVGGYRQGDFPEDYDLWLRFAASGARFAKVPETILDWREHPGRMTRTDPRYEPDAFDRLRVEHLCRDERVTMADKLIVWGAGRVTRKRVNKLVSKEITVHAWVDIDPKKIGQRINGAPVLAPDELSPRDGQLVLVYINSHGAKAGISDYLNKRGFHEGRDYLLVG